MAPAQGWHANSWSVPYFSFFNSILNITICMTGFYLFFLFSGVGGGGGNFIYYYCCFCIFALFWYFLRFTSFHVKESACSFIFFPHCVLFGILLLWFYLFIYIFFFFFIHFTFVIFSFVRIFFHLFELFCIFVVLKIFPIMEIVFATKNFDNKLFLIFHVITVLKYNTVTMNYGDVSPSTT